MKAYLAANQALGRRILEAVSLSLGLDRQRITDFFGPGHSSFLRLNHYPLGDLLSGAEAGAATALGDMALQHHSDAGVLTVLAQDDAGGLEVYHGDEWIPVPPLAGALVINIGDLMQVWSNDRYKAPLHRVRPVRDSNASSFPRSSAGAAPLATQPRCIARAASRCSRSSSARKSDSSSPPARDAAPMMKPATAK